MKHLMKRAWTKYALVALVTALVVAPTAAIAIHGFTDVPDSNIFHNNIQWMKDNGVTLGCNPPANDRYCPNNTVNRGQMAAFMQRLAENKVVDAATAVTAETATLAATATNATDADKLDGLHASELSRAGGSTLGINHASGVGSADLFSLTAPVAGAMVVNLSVNCGSFSGTTNTANDIDITVDGVTPHTRGVLLSFPHADMTGTPYDGSSVTAYVPVTAGAHTIGYKATKRSGDGSLDCDLAETAIFSPFAADGTPAATAGAVTDAGGQGTDGG